MRAIIIEDETAAARNLQALLQSVVPDIEICATLESIAESVQWLNANPQPDVLFMDIHLADGDSFRIFDLVSIECPIIFTTAYDQYAIEAFKVNSIDYLLKPINEEGVRRAIDKWQRLTSLERKKYSERVTDVAQNRPAEQTFLVHFRDKIIPLKREDIAFFHTFEERVTAYCHNGDKYQIELTMEALQTKLPSDDFFRANRQFIIARSSVQDISVWFGSRLVANLAISTPERIVIPKARVHDFKEWLKK